MQGTAHDLSPSNVLALGASIKHEVEALEESAFLLTVSWLDNEKLCVRQFPEGLFQALLRAV